MKITLSLFLILGFFSLRSCAVDLSLEHLSAKLIEGDLIFVESQSSQSEAIREATGSPWSHVGVAMKHEGVIKVIEAGARGVAITSLDDFIDLGRNRRVSIHRLSATLKDAEREALRTALKKHLGKPYDRMFRWDDNSLYCSELVWKAYRDSTGIELGRMQTFGDFDLSSPEVKKLLMKRYDMTPELFLKSKLKDEPILAPSVMMSADRLKPIFEGTVGR